MANNVKVHIEGIQVICKSDPHVKVHIAGLQVIRSSNPRVITHIVGIQVLMKTNVFQELTDDRRDRMFF